MEITGQYVSGWKNKENAMCFVFQEKSASGKIASKSA